MNVYVCVCGQAFVRLHFLYLHIYVRRYMTHANCESLNWNKIGLLISHANPGKQGPSDKKRNIPPIANGGTEKYPTGIVFTIFIPAWFTLWTIFANCRRCHISRRYIIQKSDIAVALRLVWFLQSSPRAPGLKFPLFMALRCWVAAARLCVRRRSALRPCPPPSPCCRSCNRRRSRYLICKWRLRRRKYDGIAVGDIFLLRAL